ncbi:MAG: glycoside hydrolase family 31 protein [Acetivibrio sp.]
MITKYKFGSPIETEAVTASFPLSEGSPSFGQVCTKNGFSFSCILKDSDMVFGLGEANRGINKRGFLYTSSCTDDPNHTEEKVSLYGAHNFILIDGEQKVGFFFDYPAALTFDIGYTKQNELCVTGEFTHLYLYVITGDSLLEITKQFRSMIGKSYIPPLWAFGYQQSRWGYQNKDDILNVAKKHRENHLPLDAIYLDIDYMDHYKDFTVDRDKFPDFPDFVRSMKDIGIHLVPIIDAGIKIEKGYPAYEEGVANNYFCKRQDNSDFVAGVWPGRTHFPDVLNEEVRGWFGNSYAGLINDGIDGFWNDMNEPAMFFTDEGIVTFFEQINKVEQKNIDSSTYFALKDCFSQLQNNPEDYKHFYHTLNGKKIRHDKVHNLYGYNMTRAAGEAFESLAPNKRLLLFSRSSYIGMHRYGGVWTGDNQSWWSHLLLNIKMMPSLNMCGFLYSGADLGGFGSNTTRDLLLRWLAFGIFTPLMRNHAALGTRMQECYQFENLRDFEGILRLRYRLIPYLYSEFVKAARSDAMYFRPLAFDYPEDKIARHIEDQLMLGDSLMIAPVYTANAIGRWVYLPEDMLFVKFKKEDDFSSEILPKGHHFIQVELAEVPLFILKDHFIPLCESCECTGQMDTSHLDLLGFVNSEAQYTLYEDDGLSKDYDNPNHFLTIHVFRREEEFYAESASPKKFALHIF